MNGRRLQNRNVCSSLILIIVAVTKDKERMKKKMKELRLERKLKEVAKEQDAELRFLRTEIERLREKVNYFLFW